MPTNLEKLRGLLQELFQLDQADLDFGIYRIMNTKREEIVRFLDKDLLPQVQEAFKAVQASGQGRACRSSLSEAIQQANSLGADPEQLPKVKELRQKLDESAVDVAALENEVFSHLYNFFRRYYNEGDFISLRRYKEGVYAIPYEGEEVKLHWANARPVLRQEQRELPGLRLQGERAHAGDTSERRVHFRWSRHPPSRTTTSPPTARIGGSSSCEDTPLAVENGELVIRFQYRPDGEGRKQADLNAAAVERIRQRQGLRRLDTGPLAASHRPRRTQTACSWRSTSRSIRPATRSTTSSTKTWAASCGGNSTSTSRTRSCTSTTWRHESAPKVEQYLSKIKVIRRIAHKIIDFLEQLENFQKKLWLKKKFVVETNYCITLDRVPEELYAEIAKNDAQRDEWVQLFGIDQIKGDLTTPEYSIPLSVGFLKANPRLPLSSRWFNAGFISHLLERIETLSTLDGVLVHSENMQALRLLLPELRGSVSFIYIDPPFNTGDDGFLYKDNYQHSSWVSLLCDRLALAHALLTPNGTIAISIDHEEIGTLRLLMDQLFGHENLISLVAVKRGSVTGHKAINPGVVNISEYVLIYAKDRRAWAGNDVYSQRDRDTRYSSFITNPSEPETTWTFIPLLDAVAQQHGLTREKLRETYGGGLEDVIARFVGEHGDAVVRLADVNVGGVGEDFRAAVAESRRQPDRVILHRREGFPDVYLLNGQRILFYKHKLIQVGERMETAEKASDIWLDVLPNDLHNEGGVSLKKGKKPEALISRLIAMATDEGDVVLDFFCGTGTAAAVAQKMKRRWIAVDCADYFWDKTVVRMLNVLAGEQRGVSKAFGWKGSGTFKVLRLESYEDTLSNLDVKRTKEQATLLDANKELREQYILSYMLDVESRGSQSLLNVKAFRNADHYKLNIERGGETKLVNVDLVETFNWLLGLTVKHIDVIRGVRAVDGTNPQGDRVLVLWRNLDEMGNDLLDQWFEKQGYSTRDLEYDLIYVNGDNNLENLRRQDQTWKVRLIDEEFQRLMFDVQDV